ncbi:cysteine hydrolase family protein [Actinoplanes sp. NPDC051513]|uniref:cysteine hydrolase family protein n=1 Tax=Actinoplanes sp. NPDC051513 TaxID=3363908 RepID=UPI0037A2F65F
MATDPHLEPHWDRSALITIDMQRDFLSDGPFGLAGTTEILPNLTKLTETFRATGRPIVHVVRLYPADGQDVDRVRRTLVQGGAEFARPGTPGRLLAPGLAPAGDLDDNLDDEALLRGEPQLLGPGEYALYKPRWGAFYRTRLEELLAAHSVDTLVFAGCNLPNCPRANIIEAHERDYRVVLVTDAVSQASDQGFREVAGLGTVLRTTAEAITPTV